MRVVSAAELRLMEPGLANGCRGAVFVPGETTLDPWLLVQGLAADAAASGAEFHMGCRVVHGQRDSGVWTLQADNGTQVCACLCWRRFSVAVMWLAVTGVTV